MNTDTKHTEFRERKKWVTPYISKPKLEAEIPKSITIPEAKAIVAELKAKGRIWFAPSMTEGQITNMTKQWTRSKTSKLTTTK